MAVVFLSVCLAIAICLLGSAVAQSTALETRFLHGYAQYGMINVNVAAGKLAATCSQLLCGQVCTLAAIPQGVNASVVVTNAQNTSQILYNGFVSVQVSRGDGVILGYFSHFGQAVVAALPEIAAADLPTGQLITVSEIQNLTPLNITGIVDNTGIFWVGAMGPYQYYFKATNYDSTQINELTVYIGDGTFTFSVKYTPGSVYALFFTYDETNKALTLSTVLLQSSAPPKPPHHGLTLIIIGVVVGVLILIGIGVVLFIRHRRASSAAERMPLRA
jgi:hypothetical protein